LSSSFQEVMPGF